MSFWHGRLLKQTLPHNMKIGIFSDVHNNVSNLQQAFDSMHAIGCRHFIFLGDITTPMTLQAMVNMCNGLPIDILPGNNDFSYGDLRYMVTAENVTFHRDPAVIRRYGLNFALSHTKALASNTRTNDIIDIVLYGHTHVAEKSISNGILYANPGELQGRTGLCSFAVLNTDSVSLEHYFL